MPLTVIKGETAKLTDLIDDYFYELRRFVSMLGAIDMQPKEIIAARKGAALSYSRVVAAKARLKALGIEM